MSIERCICMSERHMHAPGTCGYPPAFAIRHRVVDMEMGICRSCLGNTKPSKWVRVLSEQEGN